MKPYNCALTNKKHLTSTIQIASAVSPHIVNQIDHTHERGTGRAIIKWITRKPETRDLMQLHTQQHIYYKYTHQKDHPTFVGTIQKL